MVTITITEAVLGDINALPRFEQGLVMPLGAFYATLQKGNIFCHNMPAMIALAYILLLLA